MKNIFVPGNLLLVLNNSIWCSTEYDANWYLIIIMVIQLQVNTLIIRLI